MSVVLGILFFAFLAISIAVTIYGYVVPQRGTSGLIGPFILSWVFTATFGAGWMLFTLLGWWVFSVYVLIIVVCCAKFVGTR